MPSHILYNTLIHKYISAYLAITVTSKCIINCITLHVVQTSSHQYMASFARSRQLAMQAQKELEDLTVTQPAASQELPDYSSTSTRPQRHYAMHVSVGLAALCTWWYYLQDVPALERKLLSVLLSPVRFAYLPGMCSESCRDFAYAACGDCIYNLIRGLKPYNLS